MIGSDGEQFYGDLRSFGLTSPLQMYLSQLAAIEPLTPRQERLLALRIARGDEAAKKQLGTANLSFVVKIAAKYAKFADNDGNAFLNLIQAGNGGLMKAVDNFTPTTKPSFKTYASRWITREIRKELKL